METIGRVLIRFLGFWGFQLELKEVACDDANDFGPGRSPVTLDPYARLLLTGVF